MNNELIKKFTALVSIIAATFTFVAISLEFKGAMFDKSYLLILTIIASASAAILSIVFTQRLEKKRLQEKWVFIIYSRKDKEAADSLAKTLSERGFRPWLDTQQILPGQRWEKAVLEGIEKSAVALFLVSKNTKSEKGFFEREVKAATDLLKAHSDLNSPVIPVRLDDVEVPKELAGVQWVNLYEESGTDFLLKGLEKSLASNT